MEFGLTYLILLTCVFTGVFSYCPAKAANFADNDDEVPVKFYDGRKAAVAVCEVFPIPRAKYQADVEFIRRREAELVGQVVVAWNDARKTFELGEAAS